eukprot:2759245-Pyramimonas_sp.AAC.1
MRHLCNGKASVTITADKDMLFGIPQDPDQWRQLAAARHREAHNLSEWLDQFYEEVDHHFRNLDVRLDVEHAEVQGAGERKLVVSLCLFGCRLTRTFAEHEPVLLGEDMLVHPALLQLTFATLRPFEAFDEPGQGPRNMPEMKSKRQALAQPAAFAVSTRRRLYRVYPRGGRLGFKWWVTGHNLDPLYPWSVGCQMAAINMQYRDRAYRVNAANFSLNRGAGYLLKPRLLREGNLLGYQQLLQHPRTALAQRGTLSVLYLHLLCGVDFQHKLCSPTSQVQPARVG